mgnify:CR=1 FL=1
MAVVKKDILNKLYIVFVCVVLFLGVIIFRLTNIQFADGKKYRDLSEQLTLRNDTIYANRGSVFSADGSLLATSMTQYEIRMDAVTVDADVFEKNINETIEFYYELKKDSSDYYNFNDENELNSFGYQLLNEGKTEEAIKIFELLVSEFPNLANPYDSLGEAYYSNGNLQESLVNYQKALLLDSENSNAAEWVDRIKYPSIDSTKFYKIYSKKEYIEDIDELAKTITTRNPHPFKFIEGTQGQVWNLTNIDNTLFSGQDTGTFLVKKNKATKIIDVRGAWGFVKKNENTIIQGNYDGLYVLFKENNQWNLKNKIEGFSTPSRYFVLKGNNEIFVNHEYKGVYKLEIDKDFKKVLKVGGGVAGFALVIALLGSSLFDFESQYENGGVSSDDRFEQRMSQMTKSDAFAADLMNGIREDRASILSNDAWRTLGLIAIAMGLIYLFVIGKIKKNHLGIALSLFILADLWMVDKRYLNNSDFKKQKNMSKNFRLSPAESKMLQDTDPHYRALNTTVNIFNDASPAYFYNTIGGYNAAKLKRYQDLIENRISPEISRLNEGFEGLHTLNMLNMKYVIFGASENEVVLNPSAMGNAWFINNIAEVENADEEIAKLNSIDPRKTAVVDKKFNEFYEGFKFNSESNGTIKLTSYEPEELTYEFNSNKDEMVVFSEVFYHGNKDWISTIDGEVVPHFRVNYILRGMVVPEGKHEIVFTFKPPVYYLGENIALAGSGLIVILLGFYGFRTLKRKEKVEGE